MKKNTYQQPKLTLTTVQTECSIATGSVHIGTNTDSFTPNVEEFYEDTTTIEGFGDL
ncbi:hypothetical protein [Sphingobacterium rhinopitheci]|uniref:hypothetical protein n=1 Tax=Sphingobacterium rhinopitheci TaxID=2781960 RepID=UPI001F522916|nr:hypothetical protein [Sphingobacterium rhinopitheci]MCI0921814.1 hypothetical protein [Sphingobacterium rhinopitheci]